MSNVNNVFLSYEECVIKIEDLGEDIFKLLSELNSFYYKKVEINCSTYNSGIEYRYNDYPFLHLYNEKFHFGACALYDTKGIGTALLVFKKDSVLNLNDKLYDIPEWNDITEELYFQFSTLYDSLVLESIMLFSYLKKYSTCYFKLDLEHLFLLDKL